MRIKPRYRLLCAILAGILVLVGAGLIWYRADWRFRLGNAVRIYPRPELEVVTFQETERLSCADLASRGIEENQLLLLINSTHPLPEGFEPLLQEYNGARMHPAMVEDYVALRDALEERTGQRIYVSSDYRSSVEQEEILVTSPDGIAAEVGHSEHEAGLALDVYVKGFGGMSLIKTSAGRELARICKDYGFVIRYPEGKERITGTPYEPWHLRYVGQPHASLMDRYGLTLEEYIALLEVGVWYDVGDYYVGRFAENEILFPSNESLEGCVSPDNTGYFIITLKKS